MDSQKPNNNDPTLMKALRMALCKEITQNRIKKYRSIHRTAARSQDTYDKVIGHIITFMSGAGIVITVGLIGKKFLFF